MNNKTLIFRIGDENRPVILQNEDYHESILSTQIDRVMSLIEGNYPKKETYCQNKEWEGQETSPNKTISLLGNRGSGKTSCLYSIINILKEKRTDIYFLNVIDPAFFTSERNVLDVVIGTMFMSYERMRKECGNADRYDKLSKLRECFQKVKRNIEYMTSPRCEEDSELEDLNGLASSVELRKSICNLVDTFLSVQEKKYMLIPIDDIDLCDSHVYKMAEDIRKYLNIESVIPIITCKLEQLSQSVEQANVSKFKQMLDNKLIEVTEISAMTEAYIAKFIPVNLRVYMPELEDYAGCSFNIVEDMGKESHFESVRTGVLSLISNKTGFKFYNIKGQVSLIVPRGLRELRNLIFFLYSMDEKESNRNREMFLQYFYNTWTACLNHADRRFAKEIEEEREPSVINHLVISELNRKYGLSELRNSSVFDWNIIFKPTCRNYNLSIGDVWAVMNFISGIRSDIETRRLLFFIRTVYSFRLDQYSIEQEGNSNSKSSRSDESIELGNVVMKDISYLRQLIGGGYFTISGGELIRPDSSSNRRDIGILNGDKIKELIDSISQNPETEEEIRNLRLAEFLMLISSHYFYTKSGSITEEEISSTYRERNEVYYARNLKDAKNIRYNVTAPLFNLLNIEQTYGRFSDKIYGIASATAQSLLRQIINKKSKKFLPVAAIRNMEICEDLYQYMLLKRDTGSGTSLEKQMSTFYRNLSEYAEGGMSSFKGIADFLYDLPENTLAQYIRLVKPLIIMPIDNDFDFIPEDGLTVAQLWDKMPASMISGMSSRQEGRKAYEKKFAHAAKVKYSKAELIKNLKSMTVVD